MQDDGAACVRQNRVVLAVVATVKLREGDLTQPGATVAVHLRGDGDKQEFVAEESPA